MTHAFGGEFGTATTQRKCTCISYIKVLGWLEMNTVNDRFGKAGPLTARSTKVPMKFDSSQGLPWKKIKGDSGPLKVEITTLCGGGMENLGDPGTTHPVPLKIPPYTTDASVDVETLRPHYLTYPQCGRFSGLGELCKVKYSTVSAGDQSGRPFGESTTSMAIAFSEIKVMGSCPCGKTGDTITTETKDLNINITGSSSGTGVIRKVAEKIMNTIKHKACPAPAGGSQ